MLRRFTFSLALRFEHPLLRLLILDWRVSFLLLLVVASVSFVLILPLKLWKRTPKGFNPEIRVSTLDLIQARSLARSARTSEKNGNLQGAIQAWALALANDPGDFAVAGNYVEILLRNGKQQDLQKGLQIALWARELFQTAEADHLVILASERNQAWDLVHQAAERVEISESPLEVRMCVLKALFRSGRYREASEFLKTRISSDSRAELYRDALDCILTPSAVIPECQKLRQSLRVGSDKVEAIELYLTASAEKRDLSEFESAFKLLRQMTDRTLAFELLHLRLLLDLGRWSEARDVVNRFRAPASARDTVEIARALIQVGDRTGATGFLHGYRLEFNDSAKHRTLYARLLLDQGAVSELENFRKELHGRPWDTAEKVLVHGIACLPDPSSANINALNAVLRGASDPFYDDSWYFAAAVLVKVGQPQVAWSLLKSREGHHPGDPEFYGNLFAVAEGTKDARLMQEAAERCYQLTPNDPRVIANYAAILVMYEEQLNQAVALSALCLKANPSSDAAKINYAAALINSESFAAADLILRSVDESNLSIAARNQLRFIKLKRAAKMGDASEMNRLSALLDKSSLYSVQLSWLSNNKI